MALPFKVSLAKKNKTFKRKRSLSHELLSWLSLVVGLVLSLASFSNYLYLSKQAKQVHQQKAEQYLIFLSETIELPLWGIDNPLVQKIGSSFAKNEDIGFMRIKDDQGRVIFEKIPNSYDPHQITTKKISHDNMVVGTIELEVVLSLYQSIQHQLLIVSITTMLSLFIFLFLFVRLLFDRLLEQPLKLLIQRIKDMTIGNYLVKIEKVRYREFEVIANSFNDMAEQVLMREETLRENNQRLQTEIEERLKAEEDLTSYQDNLEELIILRTDELQMANNELAIAKDIAEAANRAKSDFLASMSHEIRTPMNAILGMLYLALKMEMPPTLLNYLSKAHNSAQSLLGIINDILDFSKIEAGRLEIEAIKFNFATVLEELVDTLSLQAEKKGIEFFVRHNFNMPTQLIGDPLRLRQVLLNLCSNAIKFTESGEVELSFEVLELTETQLNLKITVRDTGIGITPEIQKKLFQKFTQEDQSTTRRFGGTGLGLAISKHLVELMGGQIWIADSQLGKGTTICCTTPFKIDQQSMALQRQLLEKTETLVSGLHVLVVDDNEISCEILAGILRAFHIKVSITNSGSKAIEQIKQAEPPFNVVIIDWRMPSMSGDEVIRRIHADTDIVVQPKIIMVTAYGREDVMNLAQQAGVDGFLVKPVSPSILLDTIVSIVGRGRVVPSLKVIDTENIVTHYAGAKVLLVEDNEINREFAVELLASMNVSVDEVINGKQALERVQEYAYDAVLMDIQMPIMDGLEATRRIRALAQHTDKQQFATLPIIAMTAMAMAEDAEKCIAAGMTDIFQNPSCQNN